MALQIRLEGFENRARRSNLCIRGIPESITDIIATITALFQELQPGIPIEHLEMDRIHRALTPRKMGGPPSDIIAKFQYHRTKEQLLAAARDKTPLTFQGHNYQIFTDLSQLTISKRRAMKPQLLELQHHNFNYQWGFPFSIRFNYKGSKHYCKTSEELQQTLHDLHLTESRSSINTSRRRSASTSSSSPNNSTLSLRKIDNQHSHRRG